MKLLVETHNIEHFTVLNESNGKSGLYIQGPFIQMDIVNGNKRIYPSAHTAPAVDAYIAEKVSTNRALGELNHPGHPHINPERACIKIVSLHRDGSNYIGKAKVLESLPMGAIVAGLINEGVQMAVSSRGVGSVKMDSRGVSVVQSDFKLFTGADVVSDPSAPDAFVTAIMENKEWVYENGILVESTAKQIVEDNFSGNASYQQKCLNAFKELVKLVK